MALKDEKVPVTSGKEKASVRKETDAVSGMRPKIVPKNQNTLPPRLSSHPCHEVDVCRGREVSQEKVTMGPFFDNRAACTRSPCEYWHLVNFTKQKRVAESGTSVCSRIIRLMNNQTTSQKGATILKKEEKATTRTWWLL